MSEQELARQDSELNDVEQDGDAHETSAEEAEWFSVVLSILHSHV